MSALLEFIQCERLEPNLFMGRSEDFDTGQVYGGQVFGQALSAALDTVDDGRSIRSAHAYFLRRGDVNAPIYYFVDRGLDGGSVSSRRVVAQQHGKQIFTLSASFDSTEEGDSYFPSIDLPPLPSELEKHGKEEINSQFLAYFDAVRVPKEMRTTSNTLQMWVRAKDPLPKDCPSHTSTLAFMSDIGPMASLFIAAVGEDEVEKNRGEYIMASLDHTIWFHRGLAADDWLLYDCSPVSMSMGRGLAVCKYYSPKGKLIATTAQEGMIRKTKAK